MTVIRQENEFKIEVKRKDQDGEILLLCRSTGRVAKDKGIRGRQEQLFWERFEYYRSGLLKKGHTKLYGKLEIVAWASTEFSSDGATRRCTSFYIRHSLSPKPCD